MATRNTPVRTTRIPRREKILSAAIELFRDQGFHAVGIDEIGAAAGITGPGVYRHYTNKHALLVAIFDRVADDLVAAADRIVAATATPEEALRALVDFHTDFALHDRSLIAVYMQEERSLPAMDRRRIRHRQRSYLEQWVTQLTAVQPELAPNEALALVHGAIGVIASVASYEPKVARERLHELLTSKATRLLLDPLD